jgi:hypothetical protein
VQSCVAVIARQARFAKASAAAGPLQAPVAAPSRADPERPLSLTADELLPMLICVILRSSVPNLSAHFSYIQFRQDKGSELAYYLTTIRAALEYIRTSGPAASGDDGESERGPAEGTPAAGGSFAFEPEQSPPRGVSPRPSLSPEQLAESVASTLEVKDRWFRLNRYRQCWVAAEFVDLVVQQHKLSRAQATMLGRSMLLQGLIRHVSDPERDFEDDYLFFVWSGKRAAAVASSSPREDAAAQVADHELGEPDGSAMLAELRRNVAQTRQDWTAAKQLAYELGDPLSGVEVRDQAEVALFRRPCARCFPWSEGLAWLRRSKRLTEAEAFEALNALLELRLVGNLTPGRPDPWLQLAPLPGHPSEGAALAELVLNADVPLTRRGYFFSDTWCFAGAQLLDWLLDKKRARSRAEGALLARRLQNAGFLARLDRDGLFVDSPAAFFVWKLEGLATTTATK